jgi:hypothetical protein
LHGYFCEADALLPESLELVDLVGIVLSPAHPSDPTTLDQLPEPPGRYTQYLGGFILGEGVLFGHASLIPGILWYFYGGGTMSNDLPSATLLQQAHARPKSGEELELLGKQAASKYGGGGGTLSESVVEVVKHAGLSPEQVKRVIEFTNTDAFLQEFRKEGAEHKVVEFDGGPANISDVLKDLNDGGGGTVFDDGHDYSMPPPDTVKTATLNRERLGLEETKLAEAFDVAESAYPFANPLRESLDMKDKLAAAFDELGQEINHLELEYMQATDDLYFQVKQAAMGGTELGQILTAWQGVTEDPEFVKAAFSQISRRLLGEGVFTSKDAIGESLIKTASVGVANPEHPLVQGFSYYCETLSKLASNRSAQTEVGESLDQITTFLHEVTKESSAGKALRDVAVGIHHAAGRAAPGVGKAVGGAAEQATKWAPVAAATYVGAKTYKGVSEHPTTQKALSFVPGTQQSEHRKYRAAVRQQQRRGY